MITKNPMLIKKLKQYEREVKMNSKERQELHKWVAEGNSPYDKEDNKIKDDLPF